MVTTIPFQFKFISWSNPWICNVFPFLPPKKMDFYLWRITLSLFRKQLRISPAQFLQSWNWYSSMKQVTPASVTLYPFNKPTFPARMQFPGEAAELAAQKGCESSILGGFQSLHSLIWPQSCPCFEQEVGPHTSCGPFHLYCPTRL